MINAKEIKKGNYVIHEGEPHIVNDFSIEEGKINIELQCLFSEDVKNIVLDMTQGLEEANIARKCASVLFKKKGKLEIMDAYDFSVHEVDVDEELFNNSVEGDKVTYIKFNDNVRILELRKN